MTAIDALNAGLVKEALAMAFAGVRNDPDDGGARSLLTQLLCVVGDWSSAASQATVLAKESPAYGPSSAAWRWLIHLEQRRLPAASVGDGQEAANLRVRVNGAEWQGVEDVHPAYRGVFEVFVPDGRMWVEWNQVVRWVAPAPSRVCDLVWLPGELTLRDGFQGRAYAAVRYPGSALDPDPVVQLARTTRWVDLPTGGENVVGGRLLRASGTEGEASIPEIRELEVLHGA
jgi:type VI secretion system protein ImpE